MPAVSGQKISKKVTNMGHKWRGDWGQNSGFGGCKSLHSNRL